MKLPIGAPPRQRRRRRRRRSRSSSSPSSPPPPASSSRKKLVLPPFFRLVLVLATLASSSASAWTLSAFVVRSSSSVRGAQRRAATPAVLRSWPLHQPLSATAGAERRRSLPPPLLSSFYSDDFDRDDDDDDEEDEEDDDEDDDDDEYAELDDAAVADFRSRMSSLYDGGGEGEKGKKDETEADDEIDDVDELIEYARYRGSAAGGGAGTSEEQKEECWAKPLDSVAEGAVLLANPAAFCGAGANPSLLSKFGLTLPPPAELGADRRADLLPVLLVVEKSSSSSGGGGGGGETRGVLLNRRTGYLLGDLERPSDDDEGGGGDPAPLLEKFCIQPLWFGGVDNVSTGLDMLHQCPAVIGSRPLTDDGMYWGGDPGQAQETLDQPRDPAEGGGAGGGLPVLTGFDFKFFVQSTLWAPGELERQVDDGTWFVAKVSKKVIFKSRDRVGTQRAKPLWTECMELLGGKYGEARDNLYNELV